MRIDGRTKLTGIIGYPLEYSLSPMIHNAGFEHINLNWCYLPFKVRESDFARSFDGLAALGFKGFNVTMPYKEASLKLVDELDDLTKVVGAINTVVVKDERLIGHNTDVEGFLLALREKADYDPQGKKVFMAGAGGAARAVAAALGRAGVARLVVANRHPERADSIKGLMEKHFSGCETSTVSLTGSLDKEIARADLVVNATPVGLQSDSSELPFSVAEAHQGQLYCDLVYLPKETALLRAARSRGAETLGGLAMLVLQAALAFSLWTGVEAPLQVMEAAALKEIVRN